jgi:hypothetical protein
MSCKLYREHHAGRLRDLLLVEPVGFSRGGGVANAP